MYWFRALAPPAESAPPSIVHATRPARGQRPAPTTIPASVVTSSRTTITGLVSAR